MPDSYKCYGAEYVFARVCLDYIKTQLTEEALKKRTKLIVESENQEQDETTIKNIIKERSKEYFHKSYKCFFMIDKYPDLAGTMEFLNDFNEMKT